MHKPKYSKQEAARRKRNEQLFSVELSSTESQVMIAFEVRALTEREALSQAAKLAAPALRLDIPYWVRNICWVRYTDGFGSIAGQGHQSNGKLSRPYSLTKRLTVAITLGKIPRQLSLDLE